MPFHQCQVVTSQSSCHLTNDNDNEKRFSPAQSGMQPHLVKGHPLRMALILNDMLEIKRRSLHAYLV